MRRLHALLVAAGLMVAPFSAAAAPGENKRSDDPRSETFEWSMATSRGRLGVMVIGLTPELRRHFGAPEDRGVLVGRVESRSAAATAGLAVGDILIEVKGTAVDSAPDVLAVLGRVKKDEAVNLSVIRDRKPLTLSAKLLDDPSPGMRPMMNRPEIPWPSWVEEWFKSFREPWPQPPTPDAPDKTTTT